MFDASRSTISTIPKRIDVVHDRDLQRSLQMATGGDTKTVAYLPTVG
jgi:hypothetical protein